MDQKPDKSFGCTTFVLFGLVVVLALIAGCSLLTFRGFKSASRIAKENLIQAKSHGGSVTLREEALPDYSIYQKGASLDRDVFLAWKLDPRRTSIGEKSFREKAEGAAVTWNLQIEDIEDRGDGLLAKCVVPYDLQHPGNFSTSSQVTVNCEFPSSARDSLLPLRKGSWVDISGRLSLDTDEGARILDAQPASRVVEKP